MAILNEKKINRVSDLICNYALIHRVRRPLTKTFCGLRSRGTLFAFSLFLFSFFLSPFSIAFVCLSHTEPFIMINFLMAHFAPITHRKSCFSARYRCSIRRRYHFLSQVWETGQRLSTVIFSQLDYRLLDGVSYRGKNKNMVRVERVDSFESSCKTFSRVLLNQPRILHVSSI